MVTFERKHAYSLSEIADWAYSGQIALPDVQRLLVWKASQIEVLWDSILRGYPIGAFVFAWSGDSGKLELLDGQQRATAITLGLVY